MKEHSSCKPEIVYPCRWQYRLIGEERMAIIEAVSTVVDITTCSIGEGNVSSTGRYLSVNVEMTVNDEAERLRFYQLFAENQAIRVVL